MTDHVPQSNPLIGLKKLRAESLASATQAEMGKMKSLDTALNCLVREATVMALIRLINKWSMRSLDEVLNL